MASLTARLGVTPVAQRAKVSRAARRPAPFTPARRVFAKAAATEVTAEDELLDVELDAVLDDVVYDAEDADQELDLADDEIAIIEEALEAVEELEADVPADLAALAAAEMDEDDEDEKSKTTATILAEALTLDKLYNGSAEELTEDDFAELEAVAEDLEEVQEVEDVVAGSRADKFVEAPLTPAEREQIAQWKLSKSELRNLVPKDWDQINIDFFSNKKEENIPLPEFRLNVLWSQQNVAVAVDQVYSRGQVSPLTEYFFWPRNDAWEEMRESLDTRTWMNQTDKIILLNRLTQIINFWQDETTKRSVDEARTEFPDCVFASG